MNSITSKDNSRLKHARAVRDGRALNEIFVEGLRLAEEAAAANLKIAEVFFTASFADSNRGERLLSDLKKQNAPAFEVSEKLLESISDTKTPQGIVLIAERPQIGREVLAENLTSNQAPLLVILHQLNNPANVGAILRTAEAAGVNGAILTDKSADPYSAKSLRGAMGASFRLSLWTNANFADAIEFCLQNEIQTVCAELNAKKSHVEIDWRAASALIVGSEAHGLSAEEITQANESLKIPMRAPVESLNAAVACGIILFEAARQRDFS